MNADSGLAFTDRVAAYAAARPGYPPQLVALLAAELPLRAEAVIADLGCGTGLSSRVFLAAGYSVVGIEPDDAMRAEAQRELARFPKFRALGGTAEATTLPAGTVDAAIAGQAYHWFDARRFGAEVRRIVKPGGGLVLFWNARLHDDSPFMAEYDRTMTAFCPRYDAAFRDGLRDQRQPFMRVAFGGDHWRRAAFDHVHRLDRDGLIARFVSSSRAPGPGDPSYAPMLAGVHALFDRHARGGAVEIVYRMLVFYGHPR